MPSRKRILLVLVLLVLAALIIPNLRTLYEGILYYVRYAVIPDSVKPISRDGRYASLYDLVQMRNLERLQYLRTRLQAENVTVEEIAIPNSNLPNLFVRFNSTGPYTIFSAHYDKLHDDANYQGASDNTAAVSVLLASVEELARPFDSAQGGNTDNRAFLFTGEEERGLRGSAAFVEYARANQIPIRENVNFDNLGRGWLAVRPSASVPGIVFTLPFFGDWSYDGREFRASPPYPLAPTTLTQKLSRLQPDLVVLERFTAVSDSNVFQANGIPTVAISGDDIRFLDETWHTYADRVEFLDERNLDRAFALITGNW